VHQTGDLANLDGLPEEERQRLPSLIKLRKALGSLEFRRLIADITSCGPLSGTQIDLSVNIHAHTGHLLCHDDVIGTRKVRCVCAALLQLSSAVVCRAYCCC
jgi:prolyl 3-hydroxylase /prolyl 3,4-dihydroxylase